MAGSTSRCSHGRATISCRGCPATKTQPWAARHALPPPSSTNAPAVQTLHLWSTPAARQAGKGYSGGTAHLLLLRLLFCKWGVARARMPAASTGSQSAQMHSNTLSPPDDVPYTPAVLPLPCVFKPATGRSECLGSLHGPPVPNACARGCRAGNQLCSFSPPPVSGPVRYCDLHSLPPCITRPFSQHISGLHDFL